MEAVSQVVRVVVMERVAVRVGGVGGEAHIELYRQEMLYMVVRADLAGGMFFTKRYWHRW